MVWVVLAILFVGLLIVRAVNDAPRKQKDREDVQALEAEWEANADRFHQLTEYHVDEMKAKAVKEHGKVTNKDRKNIEKYRKERARDEEYKRQGEPPVGFKYDE